MTMYGYARVSSKGPKPGTGSRCPIRRWRFEESVFVDYLSGRNFDAPDNRWSNVCSLATCSW